MFKRLSSPLEEFSATERLVKSDVELLGIVGPAWNQPNGSRRVLPESFDQTRNCPRPKPRATYLGLIVAIHIHSVRRQDRLMLQTELLSPDSTRYNLSESNRTPQQ
jgi:hypothetical protein